MKSFKDIFSKLFQRSKMSYFWTTTVLFLWWYDYLLIRKVQRFVWGKVQSIGWTLLKLYTEYKHQNDMIKDGYHVDAVFLYDKNQEDCIRRYDVLRIFRDLIREQMLSNENTIEAIEFIKMCCDSAINMKLDEKAYYEIEVKYTFDHKKYKIIYSTKENNLIRFPVYTEKEIRNRDISKNGIISAMITQSPEEYEGIDVINQISLLAGPLENFYDDKEYQVQKEWLKFTDTLDQISDNGYLKILDFKGNEHTFNPEDKYLTFEK